MHFSKDCTTLGIKKRQLKYNTRVLFDTSIDEHSSFTKQCLEFDKSKSKYKSQCGIDPSMWNSWFYLFLKEEKLHI